MTAFTDTGRDWLAAVLRGTAEPTPVVDVGELIVQSEYEGVTELVSRKLGGDHAPSLRKAFAERAKLGAVASLFRESEFRQVFGLLQAAGLRPLLLKGSSLAYWLYPDSCMRPTADLDLLFESPALAEEAASILRRHGYVGGDYFGGRAHEVTLYRHLSTSIHVSVDLHWGLFNHPGFSGVLPNDQLFSSAMPVPRFDGQAMGLRPEHALIHACLHRAMNLHMGIGDRLKWLCDLNLLAPRLTDEEWANVVELSRSRGVAGVCLHAFRAAEQDLGTRFPDEMMRVLTGYSVGEWLAPERLGDWWYMQRYALRSIPSPMGKLRWLLAKIFPSLGYLRSFYGSDLSGRGLLKERVRRLMGRLT